MLCINWGLLSIKRVIWDEGVDILKKLIINFKYSEIANVAKAKLKEWGVKDE